MNHFIEEFLVLDYEKIKQNIKQYAEKNEKYYDGNPVYSALINYQLKQIDFSQLSYAVNDAYEGSEVRKHFDIDKSINIIDTISKISDCDIGFEHGQLSLDAYVDEISDIGKIEACIRSGAYFEHDLTVQHFEELGNHPSYSDKGLNLNLKVILEEKKACLFIEIMNGLGRTAKELPLSDGELRSLHKLILSEAHKDSRLAYRLGDFYLYQTAQSPEFEIIDDNTEFEHGLTLIEYKDSTRKEESNRTTIDLDNPEEYLPEGFPCKQLEPHCLFKSFEELYEIYPDDRSEMSFEDEFEFVKSCYDIYEFTGFAEEFNTPYEDGSDYNGMKFTVDGRVGYTTDDVDLECLPMWHITFENGIKLMAHPEEICKIEIERRNKEKSNQAKSGIDYNKE